MADVPRVRAWVLAFGFLLAVITYLDRVCISVAAPFMMRDLQMTVVQMSLVFSAFTLAYSLFEIPSGWLVDVKGPRRVLTRIVLWWSAFTALTGAASGFRSLLACRFFFGAGEAGAFPGIARAFSGWFPACERGQATGVMFFGSRLGGMLSAPVALVLIRQVGWRASFVVISSLGVLWATAWRAWFRDRPSEHSRVSARELAWIEQSGEVDRSLETPWRTLIGSRNLYMICVMYFSFGYGLYFYFTWLPTYLLDALHFSLFAGGLLAALPFLFAGIADVAGGWTTDRLARTRGLRTARCGLGCTAFLSGAALLLASTAVSRPIAKAVLLAFALGAADFALGACWAVCIDVGAEHAGVITAFMNTFGNLGGLLGPLVVGLVLAKWRSWTIPFYVTAAVYVAGAAAWLAIDPLRQIAGNRAPGQ